MKWQKKGLLFSPKGEEGLMNSHAQIPAPLVKKDRLRVYFSSRPKQNTTLPFYVDLDINDLTKVLYVHTKPLLELGEPGTFDEHGIMPSCIVEEDGLILLYYSGWQRSMGVPYNNYTGLAISEDGGDTFKRYSKGPVLDRTLTEIFSATSPQVWRENDKWHTWYSSGTNWHKINDKYEHTYDLKYASSNDGRNWIQPNKIGIKQKDEYEALCKPAIIKIGNKYHMWFSYRGSQNFRYGEDGYRLGYATSDDLINWTRDDRKSGIDLSKEGWDSKMIAYPAICEVKGKTIMLYNGNGFGADGFGYAVLEN